MEAARCIRGLMPLAALVLVGATGSVRPPALGAADPPWQPPPCPPAVPAGPAVSPAAGMAWYRTDAILDGSGTLAGQRLTLGVVGGPARHLDLPPESFASGPLGGRVLVGDDDGSRSRLRAIDVAGGCSTELGTEAAVIRSALLAPDGSTAYEHHVDRATRADLGVWSRSTAGGTASPVLPGVAPDARYGPTFTTELSWSADGALLVSSCGELACRTRRLDPATGRVAAIDATGPVIGAADGAVIAYATCPGAPCAIVAIDPADGRREILVDGAGPATLGGTSGAVLVYERGRGTLDTLDLRTGAHGHVTGAGGLLPLHGGSLAGAGADLAPGDVLLVPGSRLSGPADARVLDPATSALELLEEVAR